MEKKMKTTREEVEEWLSKAPKSIALDICDIEQQITSCQVVGKLTPILIKLPYIGSIKFMCKKWEEE